MAKKFDLTSKICQYLDRHLTFPLLEFLCEKEVSRRYGICNFHRLMVIGVCVHDVICFSFWVYGHKCIFTAVTISKAKSVLLFRGHFQWKCFNYFCVDRRPRSTMEANSRHCQQDKFDRLHDGYPKAIEVGRHDARGKTKKNTFSLSINKWILLSLNIDCILCF